MRVLIYCLLVCNLCKGQAPDLTNWKLDTLPLEDRIYKANNSDNNWFFEKSGNIWEVKRNVNRIERGDSLPVINKRIRKLINSIKGIKFFKKISSGYLMGVNNGEFGGGLYNIDLSSRKLHEIMQGLSIIDIFEFQSKIYAIEGIYFGDIIEIYKEEKFWKYKFVSKLIEPPRLIVDYNDEKLILTSQYILKLDKDFNVTELLKAPFYWGMLYPSSILIDGDTLYIAMREGVLKIEQFIAQPEYHWFKPK